MRDILTTIETPRLRLRCVAPDDAGAMSALMTPEVSRWVATWPSPLTREMAQARIERARAAAAAGTALPLAVERRTDGAVLGWINVGLAAERPGTAVFGYWLGAAYHGLGYMSEAAPAALALGFDRLGVASIAAGAQVDNAASLAVLKSCGMRHVDDRMIHAPARGRDEPCAWYEITAAEFAARENRSRD